MKKLFIGSICLIGGISLIFKGGVLDAAVAFLLIGALPGISYTISANGMLFCMSMLTCVSVARYVLLPVVHSLYLHMRAVSYLTKKAHLPKRRYQQV